VKFRSISRDFFLSLFFFCKEHVKDWKAKYYKKNNICEQENQLA
jgi:hypothetical protein